MTTLHYFELDLTTIFVDYNGEPLEYWISGQSSNMSWIIIDNTTNKLYGTPQQMADHWEYFFIHAKDPMYESTKVNISSYMFYNHRPEYSTEVPTINCYEGVLCTYDFMPHFYDPEGDAINFNGSYFSPSMPTSCFNTTTGLFNCTPTTSDIQSTYYILKTYRKDEFYPKTVTASISEYVYVRANRAPTLNKSIPAVTFLAGYDISFTVDADVFKDPDGEDITYSFYSSSPSASSWLSFEPTTRRFSGFPTANTNAKVYTIYVRGDDTNANSGNSSTTFKLNITNNQPPTVDTAPPNAP